MADHTIPIRVLGLVGSLRRASYNRRLLQSARELAPSGMRIELAELGDIPLYNPDLDTPPLRPDPVERLKRAVESVDGVLISTPEYNHSVPGVLQNAIDWVSRPAAKSVLAGKPIALMGASTGAAGTARAQQALKLVMMSTLAHVMPHPGVLVPQSGDKFDQNGGGLIHEPTRNFLRTFLGEFEVYVRRMGLAPASRARDAA